jgi:hypothetical protein
VQGFDEMITESDVTYRWTQVVADVGIVGVIFTEHLSEKFENKNEVESKGTHGRHLGSY